MALCRLCLRDGRAVRAAVCREIFRVEKWRAKKADGDHFLTRRGTFKYQTRHRGGQPIVGDFARSAIAESLRGRSFNKHWLAAALPLYSSTALPLAAPVRIPGIPESRMVKRKRTSHNFPARSTRPAHSTKLSGQFQTFFRASAQLEIAIVSWQESLKSNSQLSTL